MAGFRQEDKRAAIRQAILSAPDTPDRAIATAIRSRFGKCGHALVAQVRREMVRAREIGLDGRQESIVIRGGRGFEVPMVGVIAAGPPLDEPADLGERLVVNTLYPMDTVAYLVRGNSMADALIADGDYLLVRPNPDPESGTIVVAWVGEQGVTVKRWERGRKELRSQNERERWVHKMAEGDSILGEYVGIIRRA